MSIEGQGHSFTIYLSGFLCFVLYKAKKSGERLQDHWSSGFSQKLLCPFLPNFLWKLSGTRKWKSDDMMLVTWPRWPPRPYMVKTLQKSSGSGGLTSTKIVLIPIMVCSVWDLYQCKHYANPFLRFLQNHCCGESMSCYENVYTKSSEKVLWKFLVDFTNCSCNNA